MDFVSRMHVQCGVACLCNLSETILNRFYPLICLIQAQIYDFSRYDLTFYKKQQLCKHHNGGFFFFFHLLNHSLANIFLENSICRHNMTKIILLPFALCRK